MTKKLALLAAAVLLLVAGCGGAAASPEDYVEAPAQPPMSESTGSGVRDNAAGGMASDEVVQAQVNRMIIWTATIQLTVKDAEQSISDVQALARDLGGYAVGTETWLDNSQLYARITVRVPAESFDRAMSRLRGMAVRVDHETSTSEDVTDQYVDLESRLRALQAKEAQLTKLMDQAEDTEAVLAVYEQLSATQADIEQTKGRMTYLEKLSAMATITAELRPEAASRPVVEEGWQPLSTTRNAARSLVDALQGLGNVIIWIIVFLLPILLLVAVPFVVIFLVIRGIRRRRAARRAAA